MPGWSFGKENYVTVELWLYLSHLRLASPPSLILQSTFESIEYSRNFAASPLVLKGRSSAATELREQRRAEQASSASTAQAQAQSPASAARMAATTATDRGVLQFRGRVFNAAPPEYLFNSGLVLNSINISSGKDMRISLAFPQGSNGGVVGVRRSVRSVGGWRMEPAHDPVPSAQPTTLLLLSQLLFLLSVHKHIREWLNNKWSL